MAGPLFAFAAENMLKQLAAGAGPGKDTIAADLENIQKRVDAIEKDTKKVLENQDRMKDQIASVHRALAVQINASETQKLEKEITRRLEDLAEVFGDYQESGSQLELEKDERYETLKSWTKVHCRQSLRSYNDACINDKPHLYSFIHHIADFYYGLYADTSVNNSFYGLQAFVADIYAVFREMAHVQFAAAILLCTFVSPAAKHAEVADNGLETLKKQEAALRGFLPPGISFDDEYGDSALVATGGAWRLLDSNNKTKFLTSHSQTDTDRRWTPYIRIQDMSKQEYVQWGFVRQPSGLYKVKTIIGTPEFIGYSKDCQFVETHSNSPRSSNGYFAEDLHSVYSVKPGSGTVVLFKLIVLRPIPSNRSDLHIRLVDQDYKSRETDVPHLFRPEEPNHASFLLQKV